MSETLQNAWPWRWPCGALPRPPHGFHTASAFTASSLSPSFDQTYQSCLLLYHEQTNNAVKRFTQTLENGLRAYLADGLQVSLALHDTSLHSSSLPDAGMWTAAAGAATVAPARGQQVNHFRTWMWSVHPWYSVPKYTVYLYLSTCIVPNNLLAHYITVWCGTFMYGTIHCRGFAGQKEQASGIN